MSAKLRMVAFGLGGLAVLGLAEAACNVPRTHRLAAGGYAEGTVVGFRRVGQSSHLVVRYDASDGRPVRFRSEVSAPSDVGVGDLVSVRYDPDDPSMAEVDSYPAIWGRVVTPAVIGLLFGTIAMLIFLRGMLVG